MHITITTFEYPPNKRGEMEAFCRSIADRVKELGPKTAVVVDFGSGKAANVSIYASAAEADNAGFRSIELYEAAARAGLVKPTTIHRRQGTVVFDYLG